MVKEKWFWIAGMASIIAGAVLLLIAVITQGYGAASGPSSGLQSSFNFGFGFMGALLIVIGLALFTMAARMRAKRNAVDRPLYMIIAANLVVGVLVLVVVFNPLISPFESVRDSDLDGYTDEFDAYPHDKHRSVPEWLELKVTRENTATNWSVRITNIKVLEGSGVLETDEVFLDAYLYGSTSNAMIWDIGRLSELNGTWNTHIKYLDGAPYGFLSVNDTFLLDKDEYLEGTYLRIVDDHDYIISHIWIGR